MFKTYVQLTKPGIIVGNIITAAAGFLLATRGSFQPWLMLAMLVGLSLVIASACVVNNYLDRDIDQHMARTKSRALATGRVSAASALAYAAVLGAAGFGVLALWTNPLVLALGAVGFIDYVALYTPSKRYWMASTLIGSLSGAVPIVAGYAAAAGRLDLGALILFAIMVLWQMPHFYAIALYRAADYAAAELPVMPLKRPAATTKRRILAYIIAFMIALAALSFYGYAGTTYLIVVETMAAWWLWEVWNGQVSERWAKHLFKVSLQVVTIMSVMIALGSHLP